MKINKTWSDNDQRIIGPSLDREENKEDHKKLQKLYDNTYSKIKKFPYQSKEEIKKWQLLRIIEIFNHAFENVPLYRKKYKKAGFKFGDVQTWDDFNKLPSLTKDELIKAWPNQCIADGYDTEFMTTSSGSSGRFVYIAVDENAVHVDTLQGIRQLQIQTNGNFNEKDDVIFIYTCPWWFSSVNGKYKMHFLSTRLDIEKVLSKIRKINPKVVSLYPSYLRKLSDKDNRLSDYGVELLVTHSEMSTKNERIKLSKKLKIPVLDEYSSEELTRIALECPSRNYHLEEDACYIEILNPEKDVNLGTGVVGEVVGTNLLNKATPLIRYRQGDLAILHEQKKCKCGSNFRILSQPLGRMQDNIITNNKEIPASVLMDETYNWVLEARIPINGLRYQIIQKDKNGVDIFIVPGKEYGRKMSTIIKNRLRKIVGNEMNINVNIVNEVPHKGNPKYKPVISFIDKGSNLKPLLLSASL
jgi:phenylacetate-CoA ligase